MSHCEKKRHSLLILILTAVMLVGLVVSAHAGVKVDLGNCREQYVDFLAKTENLSPEAARKLCGYVEKTTNSRIIDEWELPAGTILDYYHVGRQTETGPDAAYTGSAVLVGRESRLGQTYLRQVYSKLGFIARVNRWLGDIFAPNNHLVLVPVGMLEPGQAGQIAASLTGATETRRIGIVGAEFPPWDDHSPQWGGRMDRTPDPNHRYMTTTEIVAAGRTGGSAQNTRAFPMYWNLDTNFNGTVEGSELTFQAEWQPDFYADSPGGTMTNLDPSGATRYWPPAGLHNPAWHPDPVIGTWPVDEQWHTIEKSRQQWTDAQLQNYWWNLLFNRANPNSMTNYYYENSHGKVTIEGDRASVIGWWKSAHPLDRHGYSKPWLYAQAPGTPIIRPSLVVPGHAQYDQRIVRASLDENGLNILFAEDTGPGAPELYAWVLDYDGITTGNQFGYRRIYGAGGVSLSTYHYTDPYDGRRHHWYNSGGNTWQFQRTATAAPGYTWVNFDPASESDGWNFYLVVRAGAPYYRWAWSGWAPTGGAGDPIPGNWATAYPLNAADMGCDFTPWGWGSVYHGICRGAELYNTLYTTEDVYAQTAQDTRAWVVHEGYDPAVRPVPNQKLFGDYTNPTYTVDYGFSNRLKTFWYYHHNHTWSTSDSNAQYQLRHLRNAAGNIDDIGGTVESASDKADRPYPFDSDMTDGANNGFGFQPGGAGHDADAMVGDINRALVDAGINIGSYGYNNVAYLVPNGGVADDEHAVGMRMTPRYAGYVLLPENAGLILAAHEFGHGLFGFVDLYDQDFYNNFMTLLPPNPPLKECLGLGPYSVMTRSCSGVRVDAWHKIATGWATPLAVQNDMLSTQIPQVEGTLRDPVILKLPANPYYILKGTAPASWQEYFLVENRYQTGGSYFGDPSPQGLYVYHVDNRRIKYIPRYVSDFQVEERALSVAMVQADGKMELETYSLNGQGLSAPAVATYAAGDPFPGADNVRSFSQLPTPLSADPLVPGQRWSPKSWSYGDIISAGTPPDTTIIIKPDTPTDSFTRIVNISDPGANMTADVFVKPREIVVTKDGSVTPPGTLDQGTRLQGILALKLNNPQYPGPGGAGDFSEMSTGEVIVNRIKILESGTAEQQEIGGVMQPHPAVERAYLYAETNGTAGLQTGGGTPDSRIGTATFGNYDPDLGDSVPDYAVFTSLGYRIPPDEFRILYVVYDILQNAQINPAITVGAELTDYTFIRPAAPGAVRERARNAAEFSFGAYDFPIVSSRSTIVELPDQLVVTPNPPAPGAGTVAPDSVSQGQADVPLLQLQMHATDDEVVLSRMKVDATSGAGWIDATQHLTVLRLYIDMDRNGLIDAGDILLAESNFSMAGTPLRPQAVLQLEDIPDISRRTIVAGADEYWLLSVGVDDEAPIGAQVQIKLVTSNYITLVTAVPPDTVDPTNFQDQPLAETLVKSWPATIIEPNGPPNPPLPDPDPPGFRPVHNSTISDRTPVFSWNAATDNPPDPDDPSELYYELELATDALMANIIFTGNTQATPGVTQLTLPDANALPDPGAASADYYWRVRTVDTNGARSQASIIRHFVLIGNQSPNPPTSGFWPHGAPTPLQITDTTPEYRWNHGTDPDTNDTFDTLMYYIQVADNPSFTNLLVDQDNVPVPGGTLAADPVRFNPHNAPYNKPALTVGVIYYWRVMTKDAQGAYSNADAGNNPVWTGVSVQRFEVVENRAPYAPRTPFAPFDGAEVNTKRPTISWGTQAPPDPDVSDTLDTIDFYVQLKDDEDLTTAPYTALLHRALTPTDLVTQATLGVDLQDNTQYWYRIRARDLDGTGLYSDWCAIQNFWVNTQNDPPDRPIAGFYPNNGVVISDDTPTCSWTHSTDPDPYDNQTNLHYILQFSRVDTSQANFEANVAFQYTSGDGQNWATATQVLPEDPTPPTTWYWRVRAVDDSGAQSDWSDIQYFKLDTQNQAPELLNGSVTPMYGDTTMFYQYEVTYRDADNDAPEWVQVTIDLGTAAERTLPMVKADPADNNYTDGVIYQVGVAGTDLGYGAHTWVFFSQNGARLPQTPPDTEVGPIIGLDSTLRFTNSAWNDATQYEETGIAYVEVTDPDENLNPAFRETIYCAVSSSMDTEPVTLRESAVNSGIFRGQIPLRGAAGANNDGQLNVIATAAGATITAYYMDKDDTANPDPDESTDTATVVDTTAPAPVNLPVNTLTATTGPSGRSANLDWSGYDEAAQIDVAGYRVYYAAANFGNTQAAGVQLYTTVPAGRKTATVNGLTPNTQYWFAVVAYDEVPNPSTAVATPVTPATLTTRDTTGPVISNLSPANGATEVPANTIMGFRVSDAGVGVDIGTLFVEVTVGGTPVAINVNTSDQGAYTQVTVTPTNPFAWNDVVNVDVAVWDRDGNAAPDVPWTFSIVTDTTNPQVTQQSPADGVTGVPVTTQVSFHLTDNKSGIDLSTLAVTFNGTNITGDLAPSQVNGNLDILCTYTPPENLLYSSDYKVSVTVSDFADRTSGMVEWTFRTVDDQTGVIIDQFDPAPRDDNVPIDTNIRMRMSDNQAGVNVASIRLWVDGPEVTGAIATTVQGSSVFVEYDPQQDLPYGTDIWVIVDVKDNNGNGNPFTYYFTTVAAPTYVISGRTLTAAGDPVAGVTITCDGTTTTTDGNGAYLLTNLPAGNYTVTPTKAEWSFDPLSRQITLGPNDATDVNFVGALATYSISGTVRNRAGTGQAGVAVACGTSSAITNANGQYTIAGKRRGQHTLTPLLANYQFEPVNRVVNIENSNVVGQDFTAVAGTFTISGTVYDAAGGRIQGVEVTNGVNVAVTTSAGTYTLTNLAMGAHNVTATKLGYRLLTTASLDQWQVDLPPDYTGADFVAYFELGNSFPGGIHLIGVPGTPVIGNPINVFGTTRVARWDPTANPPDYLLAQQYGDTDFMRVYPGSGYFVNFYDATNLSIAGQPTDTSRPVSMGVGVGWNMIANPFANPTPFGNFQPTIPDGVLPYAFIYNHATGSYELVSSKASINAVRSTLQPWEGAWVRCVAGGCSLNVTAQVGATAVVEPEQAEVGTGYILPVVATASGRSDTSSVAGVIPGAGSQHTLPNPPPAPASVDVYFVNSSGQQLSRDIRSQSGSCDTYEFVVSCGVGSADVTVTLPDMSSVPNNREVMLTDVDAQKTVYARTMQAYTYRSDEGTTQRRFRIDIQPRTVGSLNISAAAGQRGGGATITYSVSQLCKVNIIVRNIAGRCIKVLAADQVASAGLNTQVWNLANETGAKVPAGPYLIEIRAVADNGQQARALANITLKR